MTLDELDDAYDLLIGAKLEFSEADKLKLDFIPFVESERERRGINNPWLFEVQYYFASTNEDKIILGMTTFMEGHQSSHDCEEDCPKSRWSVG